MMKNIALSLLILLTFVACHDDDKPQIKPSEHTVIVYMVADNSLNEFAYDNINKMERGLPNNDLNLIVYFDAKDDTPKLLRIQKDNSKDIKSEIIEKYPEQNSADPTTMNTILNNIKNRYPSKSYGLILWSHADAWLPAKKPQTRAIFLYEMRNKTPFILASAIEELGDGMPYEKVTPLLFSKTNTEKKLKNIGEEFFNYYNNQKGQSQTAQTSLIKMDEVEELAKRTRSLLTQKPLPLWDYHIKDIQKLYTSYNERPLYDFMDFLEKNYNSKETAPIKEQLSKVVLYEKHTDYYLESTALNNLCGVSCYIPENYGKYSKYNSYYQTLSWTKASGFDTLFE